MTINIARGSKKKIDNAIMKATIVSWYGVVILGVFAS